MNTKQLLWRTTFVLTPLIMAGMIHACTPIFLAVGVFCSGIILMLISIIQIADEDM